MCGIVGYVGKKMQKEILIEGLLRLEYRGYDSAGLAVLDKEKRNWLFKMQRESKNLLEDEDINNILGKYWNCAQDGQHMENHLKETHIHI